MKTVLTLCLVLAAGTVAACDAGRMPPADAATVPPAQAPALPGPDPCAVVDLQEGYVCLPDPVTGAARILTRAEAAALAAGGQ
jgi:hypothetical protein